MATSNVDQESKWTDTFPCLQKCTYFHDVVQRLYTYFHDVVQRLWQIANDSTTSCEFSVEEPGENKDDNQTLGQYYSINYYCKKGIVVLYATLSFHLECNYPQRLEIQQGMAGCACQWPCHQKGHKTEQVCRQDKGNITSKRASRVSHLATRFQSWWSSFSHSSIKYPIHQWYKLLVCACVVSVNSMWSAKLTIASN